MARRPSRTSAGNTGRAWYHKGSYHRTDGPCFEFSDGTKEWWEHDVCLRIDGRQGCYDTPNGVLVRKIRDRHEAEVEAMRHRIKDLEGHGPKEWWDDIRLRIEDERLQHG